jgi:hypothetical protein
MEIIIALAGIAAIIAAGVATIKILNGTWC